MTSKHRIAGRIAAATAVVTLAVGAVAGIALAAPNTTASPSSPSAGAAHSHQKGDHKGGRLARLDKRMVHGEFVARGKDGAYVTLDTQRGEVTKVSNTSITLKSADGFTATYAVTGDTKIRRDGKPAKVGDLKVGDPAMVIATKSGGDKTAKGIVVRAPKAAKTD